MCYSYFELNSSSLNGYFHVFSSMFYTLCVLNTCRQRFRLHLNLYWVVIKCTMMRQSSNLFTRVQHLWWFISWRMWCVVVAYLVPGVLRAFVFVDCLTLEVKVLWSFKISETIHLMTVSHPSRMGSSAAHLWVPEILLPNTCHYPKPGESHLHPSILFI